MDRVDGHRSSGLVTIETHAGRSRAAGPLLGVGAALVILLTGPLLLFHPWPVGALQDRHGVAELLDLPDSEVGRLTDAILWDVFIGGDFGVELDGEPFLNADERSHMTDVSDLVRTLLLVEVVAVGAALIAGRALRTQRQRRGRALVIAASALGLVAVLLGVGSLLSFEPLFMAFHGVFFAAGTWSFPPGSHLTSLFPEALFSDAAVLAGALVLLSAGLVAWLGWHEARVMRA